MLRLDRKTAEITKKIIVIYLFLIPLIYFLISNLRLYRYNTDFCQDYVSASNIMSGKSIYLRNGCWGYSIIPHTRNPHPPFAVLPFLFLTFFSYNQAHLAWGFAIMVFYTLSIIILLKILDNFSYARLATLLTLLILWEPLRDSIVNQNTAELMLFLLSIVWFFELKNKNTIAGFLLGIASLMRFWPAVYLIFAVLSKKFKLTVSALLTVAIGFVITILVSGYGEYLIYFTEVLKEENMQILRTANVSLVSLTAKALLNYGFSIDQSIFIGKVTGLSTFLTIISITRVLAGKKIQSRNQYVLAQSISLSSLIFVFPIYWGWGLIIYLLIYTKVLYVLKQNNKMPKPWGVIFFCSAIMLFLFTAYNPRYPVNNPDILAIEHMKIISSHSVISLLGATLLLISQFWLLRHIYKKQKESP